MREHQQLSLMWCEEYGRLCHLLAPCQKQCHQLMFGRCSRQWAISQQQLHQARLPPGSPQGLFLELQHRRRPGLG